jgi:hypothetical protein
MATSRAKTVTDYLAELPSDRRKAVAAARKFVREHMPKGYREGMGYGMITWSVPRSLYPGVASGQPLCYAALAAQKQYNALYLMVPYGDKKLYGWLRDEFKKAGKRFDMGKSCLRFQTMDDLVPEAVGKIIAGMPPEQFVAYCEAAWSKSRKTARR